MSAQCELPIHPFTGLIAVGIVNGRPVWPVRGGSEEADQQEADQNDGDDDAAESEGGESEQSDDDKPLGPPGQKAYEAEKQKRRAEAARRRAAESRIAELERKLNESSDSDAGKEADAEVTRRFNDKVKRLEIKAAAAGKLADPSDAYKFIDLDAIEVDANGDVNEDDIAEAIEELVKQKPYLAAAQGGVKKHGTADGGPRNEQRPQQLTRADLKSMSPEQIKEAKSKGRLADLLSGKT